MSSLESVRKNKRVTIELGGRERVIQFDMNAFAELEKRYGSVKEAMDALSKGSIREVKICLWAGLIHEEAIFDENDDTDPIGYNITPYQVGSWINSPALMAEASKKLNEAISQDMPDLKNVTPEMTAQLRKQGYEVKNNQVVAIEGVKEVKND